MQEKEDYIVFVQTDLLLQEKEFEALRECILNLDLNKLQLYDEFSYNLDDNKVVLTHTPDHPYISNITWISLKLADGYILTYFDNLKKMLSL